MSKSTANSTPASKATPYWLRAKSAATSEPVKTAAKTAGAAVGIAAGAGVCYAVFAKAANVTFAALS